MMKHKVPMIELERAATASGLRVRHCGRGHYQLLGGSRLVNFYDTAKGSKIYVAGDSSGRFVGSVAQVIEATGPVIKQQTESEPLPALFHKLGLDIAGINVVLSRDVVSLEFDDRERAMRVFSLLEKLAEEF